MISIAKKRLMIIAEALHLRIFGHAMSDEMRIFLRQLSWSVLGGIGTSVILFLINIFAGRYLGPEMYGKYNGIVSLANAVAIVFLMSFDISSVRYLSDARFRHISSEILTTASVFVLSVGMFVSLFLVMLPGDFTSGYIEGRSNLYLIIVLAFVFSFKSLFNGFLRAFHQIKRQSVNKILDASMLAAVFLFFAFRAETFSYISYVQALVAGGSLFVLLSAFSLRRHFSGFSFVVLSKIFKEYNRFLIFASVIGLVAVADKFIIGKLAGQTELGYFSAYFTASHVVIAELSAIFMNAFWPSVIKNVKSLKEIIRKIDKIVIFASPFWVFLIMISTTVFISFFGKEFPLRLDYIVIFSVNTFLGFIFSVWTSFLNIDHIKRSVWMSGLFVAISISLLILTKSIVVYLVAQIFLQILLGYNARTFLLNVKTESDG